RLLPTGRPLAPGDPPDLPGAGDVRGRDPPAPAVRGADGRGFSAGGRVGPGRRPVRGGASPAGGRAGWSPAALLRPGAALVPRSARPGERGLQHSGGSAPPRLAGRGRARGEPSGGRLPARVAADDLPAAGGGGPGPSGAGD